MNTPLENALVQRNFCAELHANAQAAVRAAEYATEAADNVVVLSSCIAKEAEENAKIAAKLAAILAKNTLAEAAQRAAHTISDTTNMLRAISADADKSAADLIAHAAKLAADVIIVAKKSRQKLGESSDRNPQAS